MNIDISIPKIYPKEERYIVVDTFVVSPGEEPELRYMHYITDKGILKQCQQGTKRYLMKCLEVLINSNDSSLSELGNKVYTALMENKVNYYASITTISDLEVKDVVMREFELE